MLETYTKVLSSCRDVAVLAAIYLYFAGFTYKYYFFDSFHIKSVVNDVPAYVAFVYAYPVFWAHKMQIGLVTAGAIVVVIVVSRLPFRSPVLGGRILVALGVVLSIGAFPLINYWSWQTSQADANATRTAAAQGNDTGLTLNVGFTKAYGDDFLASAKGDGLHLLAKTDQYDYFLVQPSDPRASATVVAVPVSEIVSMHIDQ
jgi:hypothetical protein